MEPHECSYAWLNKLDKGAFDYASSDSGQPGDRVQLGVRQLPERKRLLELSATISTGPGGSASVSAGGTATASISADATPISAQSGVTAGGTPEGIVKAISQAPAGQPGPAVPQLDVSNILGAAATKTLLENSVPASEPAASPSPAEVVETIADAPAGQPGPTLPLTDVSNILGAAATRTLLEKAAPAPSQPTEAATPIDAPVQSSADVFSSDLFASTPPSQIGGTYSASNDGGLFDEFFSQPAAGSASNGGQGRYGCESEIGTSDWGQPVPTASHDVFNFDFF